MHITEFAGIGHANNTARPNTEAVGAVQAAARPLTSSTITLTGSNQQSAATNAATRVVRVAVTVNAWVALGSNPIATASPRMYMPLGSVEYFAIEPGQKVAGITA